MSPSPEPRPRMPSPRAPLPLSWADAWERHDWPTPAGARPWLLTCEHASPRVPAPLRTTAGDRAWLRTHWGHDIGARTLTLELGRRLGGVAVLARFSRLVVDPNRPPEHPDLARAQVEGHELRFNRGLSPAERQRRLEALHAPYHRAVDDAAGAVRAGGGGRLLSLHSFTPVWQQHLRTMHVGVLFDDFEEDARRLHHGLRRAGLAAALNEPYSGRAGLIYSAARHGRAHGLPYLELELNQALIATAAQARRMARLLAPILAGALGGPVQP